MLLNRVKGLSKNALLVKIILFDGVQKELKIHYKFDRDPNQNHVPSPPSTS